MPNNITPIVTPILSLLKSRKVLAAIAALVVNLLIAAAPGLESFRTELIVTITGLFLAVIGGIAYEDAAKAGRDAAPTAAVTPEEAARKLLLEIIDGTFGETQSVNKDALKIAVIQGKTVKPPML